jgi:hypothetical protein
MRSIFTGIILSSVFLGISALLIVPFSAETEFVAAQEAVAGYRWTQALEHFNKAASIDPFDSKYPAGTGDFFLLESFYSDNRIPKLLKARAEYDKAIRLNASSAEYYVRRGQVEIELFLNDKDKYAGEVGAAIADLKLAVSKDPNGFNIAYSAGYAGVMIWELLSENDRSFVIDRLRYAVRVRPGCAKYIYPKLWSKTRDFKLLRQVTSGIRKDRSNIISDVRNSSAGKKEPVITAKEWQGTSSDGLSKYFEGGMFWSGTADAAIFVPEGASGISIRVKGTPAGGVYPYMIVELDGEEIGEGFVENSDWKYQYFGFSGAGGLKVLSVTYLNDGTGKGEDRNLFIGEAKAE